MVNDKCFMALFPFYPIVPATGLEQRDVQSARSARHKYVTVTFGWHMRWHFLQWSSMAARPVFTRRCRSDIVLQESAVCRAEVYFAGY
jgi:hypothetical protein